MRMLANVILQSQYPKNTLFAVWKQNLTSLHGDGYFFE